MDELDHDKPHPGSVCHWNFWQLICDIAHSSVWYDLNADDNYGSYFRLFIAYVNKEMASVYLRKSQSREFSLFV
jgi:hypothetical protein